MNHKRLLFIFLTIIPVFCFSQDGVLDTSFGDNGYVFTDFYGQQDIPYGIGEQSDGKIIVIGRIENGSDYFCSLTRYLPDGSIDNTFGTNGSILNLSCSYTKIIIQNDNKFIVSGASSDDIFLMRFLENGNLDPDFGADGTIIINSSIELENLRSTILLENGKIILIGESGDSIVLIKYLENGTIDTSFGDNGRINHNISQNNRIFNGAIQETGKIVVSAKYDMINSDDSIFFIRFLENGLLDVDFGINGIFEPSIFGEFIYINAIAIDNSNRIVAAFANLDAYNEVINSSAYRVLPDGTIDESFGNNGFKNLGTFSPKSLIIQTNNRILIGGGVPFFEGSYLTMKRVLENGSIDSSFTNILEPDVQNSSFLLLNSGKILGLGNTFWFQGPENFVLTRYNNDPLGLEDQQLEKILVYPNPSTGQFKIQHDLLTVETPYQVSDITGKIIQKGKLSGEQSTIDLTQIQQGIYLLNASGKTYKLVKN